MNQFLALFLRKLLWVGAGVTFQGGGASWGMSGVHENPLLGKLELKFEVQLNVLRGRGGGGGEVGRGFKLLLLPATRTGKACTNNWTQQSTLTSPTNSRQIAMFLDHAILVVFYLSLSAVFTL